jgi:peptide-methionine (S)-S-oxide reductase
MEETMKALTIAILNLTLANLSIPGGLMNNKLIVTLSILLSLVATNALADKTVLAGGCFWCMEADFEKLKGVTDVVSGFTGGTLKNPTYNGNHEGHYEAVEITYDPARVSYQQLLDYYWVNIDPFDDGGQFCDRGHGYLSAIFVANDTERKIAEESKRKVEAMFPGGKVVTPILSASTFYPIKGDESYHQDFYKKSPVRYKVYRWNCGRDQRLKEIWGDKATH